MAHAWRGNWRARIEERLTAKGYASATAYATDRPRVTTIQLAEELGPDVAAFQIETLMLEEAVTRDDLAGFARSMLARDLREHLPGGWGEGNEPTFEREGAFGYLVSLIGERYQDASLHISVALYDLHPPPDWLPEGPDDPLLLQAFQGVSFPLPAPDAEGSDGGSSQPPAAPGGKDGDE